MLLMISLVGMVRLESSEEMTFASNSAGEDPCRRLTDGDVICFVFSGNRCRPVLEMCGWIVCVNRAVRLRKKESCVACETRVKGTIYCVEEEKGRCS